jgi:putative oxidoreductase
MEATRRGFAVETQRDVAATWDGVALVGRILLAATFVISGWGKITGFGGTAEYIASKGLPMPEVLAAIAILFELGAGLLIVVGWKARWAALALALFLVVITPIFHDFWAAAPDAQMMQLINFEKNVSILGGMLLLAAFGPGRYSVDKA